MLKIDGGTIKDLRERRELTQLYMATAVGVTTDTISRWENRRYPTIKEENAVKLAETLGVELEDILLVEDQPAANTMDSTSPPRTARQPAPKKISFALLGIVGLAAVGLAAIGARYFFFGTTGVELEAVRIMPTRALPDSPFPVVVQVKHSGAKPLSIILKEHLPKGARVIETSPSLKAKAPSTEIKWIRKIDRTTRFSYLVTIPSTGSPEKRKHIFHGTMSSAQTDDSIEVQGNHFVQMGRFHWADSNGDNTISDQEILTVFDYYNGVNDVTINIAFIEKMWLAEKYSWNSETGKISIIE
ncbi:MAG: helix-turn-helix transcriptional regulator [Desulfopila sp.]